MNLLIKTRERLIDLIHKNEWKDEKVSIVNSKTLTPEEAIGNPNRLDYPILKGKEFMMEATIRGYKGQAFTDQPGNYSGTLQDVINLKLDNNFERAVFISTCNAILRAHHLIEKTIHCKNQEPELCANHLVTYIKQNYGEPKIAFIGLQPGMVNELSKRFELRVVDLDIQNVGKKIGNAWVEAISKTEDIINWSDIIIATGSTATNNTISNFIINKPTVFYGVTVSGIAYLNNLKQYCYCGH